MIYIRSLSTFKPAFCPMLNKAPALSPPTRVGIVAPASSPKDAQAFKSGLSNLEAAGFLPVLRRNEYTENGYLAGTDSERLSEFNAFLKDDSVHALIAVRGGYGSLRLLDDIDYEAARRLPKLLVGYSDITALQLALYKHAGWVGVSGPMVAVEWPDPKASNCDQFMALASGALVDQPLDGHHSLVPLRQGRAIGPLLGGNLSLIAKLLGTAHMPDLKGAILFLEDIGESPYQVDGLVASLKLAGVLSTLSGIILGGFTEGDAEQSKPSLTLKDVFEHSFAPLGIPVAMGLRYGHFAQKAAIPIGVQAELLCESKTGQLILRESPVR